MAMPTLAPMVAAGAATAVLDAGLKISQGGDPAEVTRQMAQAGGIEVSGANRFIADAQESLAAPPRDNSFAIRAMRP